MSIPNDAIPVSQVSTLTPEQQHDFANGHGHRIYICGHESRCRCAHNTLPTVLMDEACYDCVERLPSYERFHYDLAKNIGQVEAMEAALLRSGILTETQRQGVEERIARRTRLPRVHPRRRGHDLTPRRPADNDPTRTARGRASVRRQGKRNKLHSERFKVRAEDINMALSANPAHAAEMAEYLEDPIAECKRIKEDKELSRVAEIIHNVWESKLIERYAGVCRKNLRDEMTMFDKAVELFNEAREWGAKLVWMERIERSDCVIYKVCSDNSPSETYMTRRSMGDRNVILSPTDRAKIIEIAYGD